MSNNYHFFGCSYTGWKPNNYVQELAKLEPDHNFYNWGVTGSSIILSTFVLDCVKKKYTAPNNYFIFQVTNPGRVCWWSDKYEDYLEKIQKTTDNYYRTKIDNINNEIVGGFTANSCSNQSALKYKRQYFKWTSHSTLEHDHKMHCHYAKNNSNFMFFHLQCPYKEFKDYFSVEDVLGKRRYQELCDQEDGNHFALEGAQWQAKWIRKVASEYCRWDR